jgi:hypothetical protein
MTTPSRAKFATPKVLKALRDLLFANAAVRARLGRGTHPEALPVFTEGAVPASQVSGEYLTIGPFAETPRDTMGSGAKWGSELSTAIKVVSYSKDVAPGYALMGDVVDALHGQNLEVDGYRTGWVQLDVIPDAYVELVAGVPVTHFPMLFRVHVHEAG